MTISDSVYIFQDTHIMSIEAFKEMIYISVK